MNRALRNLTQKAQARSQKPEAAALLGIRKSLETKKAMKNTSKIMGILLVVPGLALACGRGLAQEVGQVISSVEIIEQVAVPKPVRITDAVPAPRSGAGAVLKRYTAQMPRDSGSTLPCQAAPAGPLVQAPVVVIPEAASQPVPLRSAAVVAVAVAPVDTGADAQPHFPPIALQFGLGFGGGHRYRY